MDGRKLRRLRDDLGLLRERVQNAIDILHAIECKKSHERDWQNDPLYRSIRHLSYSVKEQLSEQFRRRKNGMQ